MRKTLAIGIILLVLGGIMFGGMSLAVMSNPDLVIASDSRLRGKQGLHAQPVHKVITAESELKSLDISASSRNISIVTSDSIDRVTLSYYEDYEGDAEYQEENGNLSLTIKSKFKFTMNMFGWLIKDYWERDNLVVSVPANLVLDYKLKVTSGNIKVDKISADNVEVKTTSGNVNITNVDSKNVKIELTSGNISMSNLSATNIFSHATSGNIKAEGLKDVDKAEFSQTSGNLLIKGSDIKGIEASVTSGNLRIEGLGDKREDYNLELRAKSGNIRLWGKSEGESVNDTDSSRTRYIRIKTTSGNIRIG